MVTDRPTAPSGALLVRATPGREVFTSERCFIDEWCNDPRDATASIAHARVLPGVTTRWHRLAGIVERYVVLSGCGVVEVGALAPTAVGPGDVVVIPADVAQRITCIGDQELAFLAVCTPRFVQSAYEELPDTPPPQAIGSHAPIG